MASTWESLKEFKGEIVELWLQNHALDLAECPDSLHS